MEIKHLTVMQRVGTIIYFDISVSQGMKDTYFFRIQKEKELNDSPSNLELNQVGCNSNPILSNICQ